MTPEEFNELKVSTAQAFPPTQNDCIFWVKGDQLPKIGHRQHDFHVWIENTGKEFYNDERQWYDDDVEWYIPMPEGSSDDPRLSRQPTVISPPTDATPEEVAKIIDTIYLWEEENWSDDNPGYRIIVTNEYDHYGMLTGWENTRTAAITGYHCCDPEMAQLLQRINREVFGFDHDVTKPRERV